MIKIVSAVPAKGKIRVSFVCGGRAARLFQTYMRFADKAGAALSCPVDKLSSAASDLKYRLSEAEKRANRLETREILAKMEEAGEDLQGVTLCVMTLPETDGRAVTAALSEAEKRANALESREILARMAATETAEDLPGVTLCVLQLPETDSRAVAAAASAYIGEKGKALLLSAGERLTVARSAAVRIDMTARIKRVARGGGRPDMASGAGIPECVTVARKILKTEGIGK